MTPDMIPVDSTNIEAIGYDATRRELYIRFLGNRTYVYSDIPAELHDELMRAPSKGSFLNRAVKNTYAYREI